MKNPVNPKILPWFTLSAGVLGMVLRFWLFSVGIDDRGLLVESHPANALTFILTALTLVVIFLAARNSAPEGFSRSKLGAAACFIAALGILIADFSEMAAVGDLFSIVSFILGLVCAVCLVLNGLCRLQGKEAPLAGHVLIAGYFMIHLVLQYRLWSAEPQLQTYFFPLLASVLLMLYSYHRAMLDQVGKNGRRCLFFGQAALLFCLMSAATQSGLFYLCMAAWTAMEFPFPAQGQEV